MVKESFIKLCDKSISFLVLGIIFFLPLYFNPFVFRGFDKVILFRVLVEILFFLYLMRVAVSGRWSIKKSPFFYRSIFLILLSQILATVFSDHRFIGFWGSYFRLLGVFTWIHIFVFAFIVFNSLDKNGLKSRRVLWTILGAGVISSFYAILQINGLGGFAWEIYDKTNMRAFGSLGQPNYLGSYLLLVLPVGYYHFRREKGYGKILPALVFLPIFYAFMATYSRAAWLGLLLVSLVFLFIYLFKKQGKILVFASVIVLAISGAGFFYMARVPSDINTIERIGIANRLKSLADFKRGSAGMRSLFYQASFDIIRQNPLLGVGLDSQIYYFSRYYQPRYAVFERINRYPDRAHNEILEIIITTGFLGIAAWTFLVYGLLKSFLAIREKENKEVADCLVFALATLVISLLFGFFTEVLLVYFFLYLAIIFAYSTNTSTVINFTLRRSLVGVFLVAVFFGLAFFVWDKNIKLVLADYHYNRARLNILGEEKNFLEYEKAVHYAPRENFYRQHMAIEMLPAILKLDDRQKKALAMEYLREVIEKGDQKNMTLEARAYLAIVLSEIAKLKFDAGETDADEFDRAGEIFEKLTINTPNMARLYYDWGILSMHGKKYEEALAKFKKALSLYPDLNDPAMNKEHRQYVAEEMAMVQNKILELEALRVDNSFVTEASK